MILFFDDAVDSEADISQDDLYCSDDVLSSSCDCLVFPDLYCQKCCNFAYIAILSELLIQFPKLEDKEW